MVISGSVVGIHLIGFRPSVERVVVNQERIQVAAEQCVDPDAYGDFSVVLADNVGSEPNTWEWIVREVAWTGHQIEFSFSSDPVDHYYADLRPIGLGISL